MPKEDIRAMRKAIRSGISLEKHMSSDQKAAVREDIKAMRNEIRESKIVKTKDIGKGGILSERFEELINKCEGKDLDGCIEKLKRLIALAEVKKGRE